MFQNNLWRKDVCECVCVCVCVCVCERDRQTVCNFRGVCWRVDMCRGASRLHVPEFQHSAYWLWAVSGISQHGWGFVRCSLSSVSLPEWFCNVLSGFQMSREQISSFGTSVYLYPCMFVLCAYVHSTSVHVDFSFGAKRNFLLRKFDFPDDVLTSRNMINIAWLRLTGLEIPR